MFCTSCGTKNSDDGNFCKQCGLSLDKPHHNRISEKEFERAMPEDEQLTSLLERAYRARKEGDRLAAIALCLEALALRPNSTSSHSLLGQLYEQGGERDLAIEQYEQVLALNPGSIADRVKLDELRGDVPSTISQKRPQPHIVMADRAKENAPLDLRVPAFVLAGVALMVLGGIFTMQMLTRQGAARNSTLDRAALSSSNVQTASNQPGAGQPVVGTNSISSAGQNSVPDFNSAYNSLRGPDQPIIIQSPPVQYTGGYPGPGRARGSSAEADNTNSHSNQTTNSAQDSGKEFGGTVVHLTNEDAQSEPNHDQSPPAAKGRNSITITQAPANGQGSPASTNDTPVASNTRKNESMAQSLTEQGQFKQAGDAYLRALDGAGDETAYVYRQAAWCFEKAGEKVTAVNYYKQAIDAAQKLVSSGHQPEIAKNLIRACQTGIKACSN